jgi:PAS domain S-box-containing protein
MGPLTPSAAGVWVGESSPLLAVWFDQDLRLLGASFLFLQRTGYRREDLLGRPFVTLFGESPHPKAGRGQMTEAKTFRELTALLKGADGTLIEALWSTQIDRGPGGEVIGGAAYFVDVTAQRRAEQALSQRERELSLIFNGTCDLMALLRVEYPGPVFRFVQINQTYVKTVQRFGFRLTSTDFEGRDLNEMFTALNFEPDRIAFILDRYHSVVESRQVCSYSETLPTPLGTFHAEVVLSPVFDDDGEVGHVLFVCRDVSEQKRIEAQLLLADRMVSMGTMAAGVAHEINNPLSYVAGNVAFCQQRLRDLLETVPAAADIVAHLLPALEDAAGGAARVATIVRDLKLFSRSEDVPKGPVVLSAVLGSVLRMLNAEIEHRAKVVLDLKPVPAVWGTEARLGQVFTNLLVNAVQAMPIRSADENIILVRVRPGEEGTVVAEVCDNGPGVPLEVRGRIFDLFFTTKPVGLGTGLGLSICHRIVTSFGGNIELDQDSGRGATFRIILRAWEDRAMPNQALGAGPGSQPSNASPIHETRPRVIVLDDDMVVRRVLARLLRDRYDVVVEADPEAVLTRFRQGEGADAILCDVIMPGLSGMDFHRRLAEIQPRLLARCIFMTGGAVSDQMQSFLESLPPERILEKPFNPPRLFLLLEELVGHLRTA